LTPEDSSQSTGSATIRDSRLEKWHQAEGHRIGA
jgi:hypothetical protein